MKVTLDLSLSQIKDLAQLVIRDSDTANKQGQEYILWQIAEQIGLCDEDGNPSLPTR